MEPERQVTTKTQTTAKQKTMLILGILGLMGFGFAIAVVSQAGSSVTPSRTETYTLKAATVGEMKTVAQQAIQKHDPSMSTEEAKFQAENVIRAIEFVEDAPQMGIPKCSSCNFPSRVGTCVAGGCVEVSGNVDCNYRPLPEDCKIESVSASISWGLDW